ncbi:uncharacterized protein LOC101859334 [Aplysia californica]|uniref:Uncharacterized protein LOC101859334 n=1 Tax=Aplysia californica TaxID=6500 RepID=A0ABM0JSA3_APLCA|nr:uncharacterized protein LOC101859334 [Aplysia californica]
MLVNNTSVLSEREKRYSDVLTAYEYNTYFRQTFSTAWLFITGSGIILNSVSIQAFFTMGLKDSVTTSMFYQSVADLGFVLAAFIQALAFVVRIFDVRDTTILTLDPFLILAYFANIRQIFYSVAILTTTFIAVARCMCVYMPLKFKGMFTIKRTVATLSGFTIFAFLNHFPTVLTLQVVSKGQNVTRIGVKFSKAYRLATDIELLTSDGILSSATEVIGVICFTVLVRCLQNSSKQRRVMRAPFSPGDHVIPNGDSTATKAISLSGKELQVVRQVALLCAIYIFCNIPNVGVAVSRLIIPGFHLGGGLNFLYSMVVSLRVLFDCLNSSVNFFVYYKYNSKFRGALCGEGKGKAETRKTVISHGTQCKGGGKGVV